MKIVITGASGFLGSTLMGALIDDNTLYGTCLKREGRGLIPVDLTDEVTTHDFLEEVQPELIIHTVALTDVDECQRNINKAYQVNVLTTKNIAEWISMSGKQIKFIYISTDHVYDGYPANKEENINLINIYALTKFFAENISSLLPDSLALRVNFFGSSSIRTTYFNWILENLKTGENFSAFTDVIFSPLFVKHLCSLIKESINKELTGVFNIGSADFISKAEFALKVADVFGYDKNNINLTSVREAHLSAPRPRNMAMDSRKFERAVGLIMPTVDDSIKMIFEDLTGGENAIVPDC